MRVAKSKAMISLAITAKLIVTTKLICAFAFAYAKCLFSHNAGPVFI